MYKYIYIPIFLYAICLNRSPLLERMTDFEGVCAAASWSWVKGEMNEHHIFLYCHFQCYAQEKKMRAFKSCDCTEHQKWQPWGLPGPCMVFWKQTCCHLCGLAAWAWSTHCMTLTGVSRAKSRKINEFRPLEYKQWSLERSQETSLTGNSSEL